MNANPGYLKLLGVLVTFEANRPRDPGHIHRLDLPHSPAAELVPRQWPSSHAQKLRAVPDTPIAPKAVQLVLQSICVAKPALNSKL